MGAPDNDVDLNAFIHAEGQRIRRFKNWWESGNRDSPTDYPMTMSLGEWEEQLLLWIDEAEMAMAQGGDDVTPEMELAGLRAMAAFDGRFGSEEECIRAIYIAMAERRCP